MILSNNNRCFIAGCVVLALRIVPVLVPFHRRKQNLVPVPYFHQNKFGFSILFQVLKIRSGSR
jgi:hypothetical protein